MRILGIETSCDETSAAVTDGGTRVLSNVIASSRKTFERAGGVIPEQAAREQVRCILPVIRQALEQAQLSPADLDAVAVTRGPGLLGSLIIGTSTARTLAALWGKPLIGVHHTFGHLSSTWLDAPADDPPAFPILTLSASGGHTELWYRESHVNGTLVGRTQDDAAGEAFDKGAVLLGLPYPGGPALAKLAEEGDETAFEFPLPLRDEPGCSFSFSGLKTAMRYVLRDLGTAAESRRSDLAASFQFAICRHLVHRLERALKDYPAAEIHVVGGVSANTRLRTMIAERCRARLRHPATLAYCTDNAAMIAAGAEFLAREIGDAAYAPFTVDDSLPLERALAVA